MVRWLVLALVLSPVALVAQTHPQSDAEARAALAGDWRYDPLRSEEVADKIRGGRGGLPGGLGPRPGGFGGGTRGGRGRGGGEGGNPGEFQGLMGRSTLSELLRPPTQLTVSIEDSTVTMRADLGVARPLYLDGRATVDTLTDLSARSSTARWDKGRLEVTRKVRDGGKVKELYWYDAESQSLVVDVKIEGMPRKIEIRRLYLKATT